MSSTEHPTTVIPPDSTFVGVTNPEELYFWAERFDVSPAALKKAVEFVGPSFKDVEFYFSDRWQ